MLSGYSFAPLRVEDNLAGLGPVIQLVSNSLSAVSCLTHAVLPPRESLLRSQVPVSLHDPAFRTATPVLLGPMITTADNCQVGAGRLSAPAG
jgi:hypothetical protein